MKKLIVGLYASAFLFNSAFADLNVIADFGGESALRFYEPLQPQNSPEEIKAVNPNALPAEFHESDLLPIVSHSLTPGKVTPRQFNLPGMQPIFLVGVDELSQKWLAQRKSLLIKINAVGLVVNVDDYAKLQNIRQIVPEISLQPVSADDLAKRLNLYHYPVLITDKGLSQ